MTKLRFYDPSEIEPLLAKRDLTPHELGVAYLSMLMPSINGHTKNGKNKTLINKIQRHIYLENRNFFDIYNEYQMLGIYLFDIHRAMLAQFNIYTIGRNYGELILKTSVHVLETTFKEKEAENIIQFVRAFYHATRILIAWNCFIDIIASVFHLLESDLSELRIMKITKSDIEAINDLSKIQVTFGPDDFPPPLELEESSLEEIPDDFPDELPKETMYDSYEEPSEEILGKILDELDNEDDDNDETDDIPSSIKANMYIDLLASDNLDFPSKEQVNRFKDRYRKIVWGKSINTKMTCYRFNESFLGICFCDNKEDWEQWQIIKNS